MTTETIASVYRGHSEFDDAVWALLSHFHPHSFPATPPVTGFDHIDQLGLFALAGATITPHQEHDGYTIEIPQGDRARFLEQLITLLEQQAAADALVPVVALEFSGRRYTLEQLELCACGHPPGDHQSAGTRFPHPPRYGLCHRTGCPCQRYTPPTPTP